MKKRDINLVQKKKMINHESRYDSNRNEMYYALEINEDRLYSFDIDNKHLEKILLKLKGQIEETLGYNKIKNKCKASKEELDKIAEYHARNHKTCSSCNLKFEYCYECVFDYDNHLERYLFREYKIRNIEDRDFEKDLNRLEETFDNYEGCQGYCKYKYEKCFECALICQSPLEQKFYIEALNNGLDSKLKLQMVINKQGEIFNNINKVDRNNILTIPDFYLEKEEEKLCLYTDGFTYHERKENQAIRDRNIDRELQKMGFKVMRYTTKEVKNNIEDIIRSIIDLE